MISYEFNLMCIYKLFANHNTEPTKFCNLEFCGPENPIQKDFLGNKIKLPHLFSISQTPKNSRSL